jgi:hypothetical protein
MSFYVRNFSVSSSLLRSIILREISEINALNDSRICTMDFVLDCDWYDEMVFCSVT